MSESTILTGTLWCGQLRTADEFAEANRLYQRVFHYEPIDFSLNANLLSALASNGGSAVGVRDGERLVGFAYGFLGTDRNEFFHYSQAAVVDGDYQGRGIGHMLKEKQRHIALEWGTTHMHWTFDPMFSRNGHFNFNTLKAIGAQFAEDYYGRPDSDRLIVDWTLDEQPDPYAALRKPANLPELSRANWGTALTADGVTYVVIPGTVAAGESQAALASVHLLLRETLHRVFDAGEVIIGCQRVDAQTSVYVCAPRVAL